MSKLNGFPQGGEEPLSSTSGAKGQAEPTGWIFDGAERGSIILQIAMWENTFRDDPEFRRVIQNFLRQLLGESAYEQRGDCSSSEVNEHSPESASGAVVSGPPLSILERRDLILTLLRIQNTAKEDLKLGEALRFFLLEVIIRFMITGDAKSQEATPLGLLVLDALVSACESDQSFGDAVRQRLERLMGGGQRKMPEPTSN